MLSCWPGAAWCLCDIGVPRVTWVLAKQPWASELAWTGRRGQQLPQSGEPGPASPLHRRLQGRVHTWRRRGHSRTQAAHRMSGQEGQLPGSSRLWAHRPGERGARDSLCGFWSPLHRRARCGSPSLLSLSPRGPVLLLVPPLPQINGLPGMEGTPGALAHHTPPGQVGWLSMATPWSPGDPLAWVPQTMPVGDKQSGNRLLSSGAQWDLLLLVGAQEKPNPPQIPSLLLLISLPSS